MEIYILVSIRHNDNNTCVGGKRMKDLGKMADTLNSHHFQVHVVDNAQQAVQAVLDLIPGGASVGFGGSTTVKDLGLGAG